MQKIEAIVSDSDGTLVDTVDLIRHGQYETARRYFTGHGIPSEEIPDFRTYDELLTQAIGGSARDTLERTARLLYEASPHHLVNMNFDELHDMLNPIQDALAPDFVKAYEGLAEFLQTLGDHGIKLAIFTSGTSHHVVRNFGIALPELNLRGLYLDTTKTDEEKMDIFTRRIMEVFHISTFTVITSDDTQRHKPDPEPLNAAMMRLGVNADVTAVLGDHKVDMQTAINAGVRTRIGITHGFDDESTLRDNGATHIVNSFNELSELICVECY